MTLIAAFLVATLCLAVLPRGLIGRGGLFSPGFLMSYLAHLSIAIAPATLLVTLVGAVPFEAVAGLTVAGVVLAFLVTAPIKGIRFVRA